MGFFDFLKGNSQQKRARGGGRTVDERKKLEDLRFLRDLRREDPSRYRDIMLRRHGWGDDKDQFTELEQMVKRLKGMGVIKGANDLGSESLVRDVIAGLASAFAMYQTGQAAAAQGQAAPLVVSPPAPAPEPSAQSPEPAPVAHHAPQEEYMSWISMYIIRQLDGKSAEQAAAWILGQSHPQATQIAQQLCATPDDQLLVNLADLAAKYPDVAGLIQWLRARPEWLVATIAALRRAQTAKAGGMGL